MTYVCVRCQIKRRLRIRRTHAMITGDYRTDVAGRERVLLPVVLAT